MYSGQSGDSVSEITSLVLVDDHDIVRFGLETLFQSASGFAVVGSATSLAQALQLIASKQPDIVVTDLSLEDSKGLDTVKAVVSAQANRPVLVVSMHDELVYAEQALALGARGYVMKDQAYSQAEPAVRALANGDVWVSARVSSKLLGRTGTRTSDALLRRPAESVTLRELEVLEHLRKGLTTKEIAFHLQISARTVDIHRANIKRKLGVRSSAELLTYALTKL